MSRQEQLDRLKFTHDKVLIVGQQPNANDPEDPLSPDHKMWAGYRLMSLAGLSPEDYRLMFDRVNINYLNEGKFTASVAQRNRAVDIYRTLNKGDTLVILGTAVLKCFKGLVAQNLEPCMLYSVTREVEKGFGREWRIDTEVFCEVVLIPHPSGLNRWWNDPSNTMKAARVLQSLAMGKPPSTFT